MWPEYPKIYDEDDNRWLSPWENYYKDLEEYGQETADYNYEWLKEQVED